MKGCGNHIQGKETKRLGKGKIAIFGGTAEGRWLVEQLADKVEHLHYFAATEYGASFPSIPKSVVTHAGRLAQTQMEEVFRRLDIELCLDATHPYAVEVSKNLLAACKTVGLEYMRVYRSETDAAPFAADRIWFVDSEAEAAEFLAGQTGRIFLTTGSRELESYTGIPDYQNRCVARVLPLLEVMEKCHALGFEGRNLICMQGPFSEEMNLLMFRETGVKWLVTKSSGKAGGYLEKCSAASYLDMGIVVVGRPPEAAAKRWTAEEVLELLAGRYGWTTEVEENRQAGQKRRLYLVAMGPGREALLTGEALSALSDSDVLIGAERIVSIYSGYREKSCFFSSRREEILAFLQAHPEYRSAAVCFSGDIGFYSGSKGLRQAVEEMEDSGFSLVPVSGISSVTYFLNRLGKSWEQVTWRSCHGRQADPSAVVRKGKTVCTLLGEEMDVSRICEDLIRQGLSETMVTVGSRLSYEDERIVSGKPEAFVGQRFDRLSVLLLEPAQLPCQEIE